MLGRVALHSFPQDPAEPADGARDQEAPTSVSHETEKVSPKSRGPVSLCRRLSSEVLGQPSQEGGHRFLHPIVECQFLEPYNPSEEMQ